MPEPTPHARMPLSEYTSGELLREFTRPVPVSSLGALDKLPPYVLRLITDYLDFQSIVRLSQTSMAGFILLQTLPAYRDMIMYAPTVLTALGRSQLLKYHASSVVHQALRQESLCRACGKTFGGHVFLPTFERVCFTCLNSNLFYRMIPYHIIVRFRLLTQAQRLRLHVMHADSHFYRQPPTNGRQHRVQYLVSVKQIRQAKFGPFQTQLQNQLGRAAAERLHNSELLYIQGAASDPRDPTTYASFAGRLEGGMHDYPGRAYMRFPNISEIPGGGVNVEHGVSCLGCRYVYKLASDEIEPERRLLDTSAPILYIADRRLIRQDRLLRKEEFLEHVLICPGIEEFRTRAEEITNGAS
ncbi:hypothetical protein V8C37DRAFT_409807 [Trichoderma ceciliae]